MPRSRSAASTSALVQPHDHLARSASWGCRQEEGPACRGSDARVRERRREFCEGLAGDRPAAAGLRGRVRGQHGDGPDVWPSPGGAAGVHGHPRPWESTTLTCGMRLSGVMATLAFPGAANTGRVRDLRGGGAGPGNQHHRQSRWYEEGPLKGPLG